MSTKEKKDKAVRYTLRFAQGDCTTESEGGDVLEAIMNLRRPLKVTGKCIVTVEHAGRRAEMMLMPAKARRLFYPIARSYFAKQFEYLLK